MRQTPAGLRDHLVTVQVPIGRESDGDGSWRDTWATLAEVYAAITTPTANQLERIRMGTVTATLIHVVTIPYLAGVTTLARVVKGTRTFSVLGVENTDERDIQLVLYCAEQEVLETVPMETGTP